MFYDAHIHLKNMEWGGFIIGIEGVTKDKDTLNNRQALVLHSPENKYISFYYVTKSECSSKKIKWKYLKYHARREQYTSEQVINSISMNNPKAVILDTLNEPYWKAYDYWKIARRFPQVIFVFAHAGGYLINEFIKICHLQSNVWLDFSYTHTVLGGLGTGMNALPYINQAIDYSLNAPYKKRVLFGTDYPFCNQIDALKRYGKYIDMLNDNFEQLCNRINMAGEE